MADLAAPRGRWLGAVWSGRALEWSILLAVVLALIGTYGAQVRSLQAQAEGASINSTLGALRTSLVVEHLRSQVRPDSGKAVSVQRNPFKVLDTLPANYAGEVAMADIYNAPPGTWVFDAACPCVGYRPLHPQSLQPARTPAVLWFRVSAPPAALQLTPLEVYEWQGNAIQ